MNVVRSEQFNADVERQFRWYLVGSGLDAWPANQLAERFAHNVEDTLDFLSKHPETGRPRLKTTSGPSVMRSWSLKTPFSRFLIFYRFDGSTLSAERLLEGHSRLAAQT